MARHHIFRCRIGSIALNAGDPAHCPRSDQLGNARPNPSGANCDLGAIESNSLSATETATPTATLTLTTVANPTATPTATPIPSDFVEVGNDCSLADAIRAANTDTAVGGCAAGSGGDKIILSGNLRFSSALPSITSEILVEGAYHELDVRFNGHLFDVASNGNLTISRVRFNSDNNSAWVRLRSYITNAGTLLVTGSSFRNGKSGRGGAIFNTGQMTVRSSFFSGNVSGVHGGAIRNQGARDDQQQHLHGKQRWLRNCHRE